MRTDSSIDSEKMAHLFHAYISQDDSLFTKNFNKKSKFSALRTVPHEETIHPADYLEVLDYEKVSQLIEEQDTFSIGACSCRHKNYHTKEAGCAVPINKCSSLGHGAEYLIRNNLARKVSKSEMLENIARSKELGLVFNADNVQKNITFICHCCKCCCLPLKRIRESGYTNVIVTSSVIADIDENMCVGCGKCARACPVETIDIEIKSASSPKKQRVAKLNSALCIGCGVCALNCSKDAIKLIKRKQKVIHPETTFERIILMSLERGNLQNQIFSDPKNLTHKLMRSFVGGFLKLPPVKQLLVSNLLRSTFLKSMKQGVTLTGNEWLTKI
jgi:ferredoxin